MLLFASEILGLLKLGPGLLGGTRGGGIDLERICSPQARQLPRPTSPLPTPIWGLPCCLRVAGCFSCWAPWGCPAPSAAPEDSSAGIKGVFPGPERPGCSALSCGRR